MATEAQWNNQNMLEFLELYHGEPLLWNPTHRQHKNRNAVADAWQRIQASFSLPRTVPELKKKKESLMTSYRSYANKAKQSIRSGAGADEVFQPIWFAYELMDSFLGVVYSGNKTTVNTETQPIIAEDDNTTNENSSTSSTEAAKQSTAKKRRHPELAKASKQMEQAMDALNRISERSKEVDEVDLFCQLLAKKIKKFEDPQRDAIMLEIDQILYREKRIYNSHTRQYQVMSTPSSSSMSTPIHSPSNTLLALSPQHFTSIAPVTQYDSRTNEANTHYQDSQQYHY